MNQEQYLKNRVENQIGWYDRKSKINHTSYKILRAVEIVSAALIPFVAGFRDSIPHSNFLVGILGVIISVSAGLIALNKFQENWLNYRTTCESLRHQKYLFITGSEPYEDSDSFNAFVTQVEHLISKENLQWAMTTRKKEHNKATQSDNSSGV